ncbi:MAG: ABC transporter substrate-binding protein [Phycisphaerales bacterium JB050]
MLLLMVSAMVVAAWVAGPRLSEAEEPRAWRVGFAPWIAFDLCVYAEEAGLFEKHGLDVELIGFDEENDVVRALISGDLDAAFCSLGTVVANADGTGLDVILVTNVSHGSDGLVARAGLDGLGDLKGMRIGSKQRAINRLILSEALEHAGMSLDDIEISDVSNTAAKRMLRDGQLDGAVLWEPCLSEVAEAIGGRVVYRTSELNSVVVDLMLMRTDRASGRDDEILGLRSAWFELLRHIEDRPHEVFGVAGEIMGQDPEAMRRAWSGVHAGDASLNARVLGDGFSNYLSRTAYYLRRDVPLSVRVNPVVTQWGAAQ